MKITKNMKKMTYYSEPRWEQTQIDSEYGHDRIYLGK
jgi:hypothetical protein